MPRRYSPGHWSEFRLPGECGPSKTPRKSFNSRPERARDGPSLVGQLRTRWRCPRPPIVRQAMPNPFCSPEFPVRDEAGPRGCGRSQNFASRKASFRHVRGALRFPDGALCVLAACGFPPNSLRPPTQGYPVWRAHTKLAAAVRRGFRGFQMNRQLHHDRAMSSTARL